ncbi:META domain-containing protein [Aquimarina muelleri]|uniref:META domain-containing protein n=1 Tax=Aquimarina muelleri TaxID=279356 RepID=UPI003F68443B
MKYLIFFLFPVLFSKPNSCNSNAKKTTKSEIQSIKHEKFFITTLNKINVSKEKLYIIFNDENNTVSGFSGCNTYSSKYTNNKDHISFEHPIATKMYCERNAAIEKVFFENLTQSNIIVFKQDSLFLKDKNNTILFKGILSPKD